MNGCVISKVSLLDCLKTRARALDVLSFKFYDFLNVFVGKDKTRKVKDGIVEIVYELKLTE